MKFGTVYKYLKRFLCFVRLCFYAREKLKLATLRNDDTKTVLTGYLLRVIYRM